MTITAAPVASPSSTDEKPGYLNIDPMAGWGVDLVDLSPRDYDVFMAGMLSGYLEGETAGYTRGRAAAEAELAAIQRAAARVVRVMASREPNPDTVARLDAMHGVTTS